MIDELSPDAPVGFVGHDFGAQIAYPAMAATLATSMPAPVAMYRSGGFDVAEQPIAVPTLAVNGADDGCARPFLGDGQERLFTSAYQTETWPGTGHFPHLEHPERAAHRILDWLSSHLPAAH